MSCYCEPCLFPSLFQNQSYQAFDLSYTLDSQTLSWPGDISFQHCVSCFHNEEYNYDATMGRFTCSEHSGTHIDAPVHFYKDGITVDQLTLQQLIASVKVIDIHLRCQESHNTNYTLTKQDIVLFESEYGLLQPNDVILIRTGWAHRSQQGRKHYYGHDEAIDGPYDPKIHELSFPGIGADAAEYFVERKVGAVGLDAPSLDCGASKDFIAHRILLSNGIYGIENLNHEIDRLPVVGGIILAMPLKLVGGSGSPSRVTVLVPK